MIVGIDNGLDGGLVFLQDDGLVIDKYVMPTLKLTKSRRDFDLAELRRILDAAPLTHAFVERAQAMPAQGVTSMFTTGCGFGINKGMLAGLQIPFTVVSPQTWQRELFMGLPKEGKETARIVCQRLWPKVDWRATEKCRVPHDGLCDAALIAEYGRRLLRGKTDA